MPSTGGVEARPSPDVAPVDLRDVDVFRRTGRGRSGGCVAATGEDLSQAEDDPHRNRHMTLASAEEGAMRLTAPVATSVSPPPPIDLQPLDVLATILAVRRKQLGVG